MRLQMYACDYKCILVTTNVYIATDTQNTLATPRDVPWHVEAASHCCWPSQWRTAPQPGGEAFEVKRLNNALNATSRSLPSVCDRHEKYAASATRKALAFFGNIF